MERRGPFEGGVAAEYQSVMSIGPNKVMNGNCEPPSGRTSIRSSRPVAFPPLYPILSTLPPFSIRHESSLSSILNRLIGFYRRAKGSIITQGVDRCNDPSSPTFHPPLFSSDSILRTTPYLHDSSLFFSTISILNIEGIDNSGARIR